MKDFLRGTLDNLNPLSCLRGNALVLSKILGEVDAFYESHIDRGSVPWRTLGVLTIPFPDPTGLNICMMPINLLGLAYIDALPTNCWPYIDMIQACTCRFSKKVDLSFVRSPTLIRLGYLSISEQLVDVGCIHGISGLHIGAWGDDDDRHGQSPNTGQYMVSNVAESCEIFPQMIVRPSEVTSTKRRGYIEHMRNRLGNVGKKLAANELVSLTDRTPHTSLPIPPQYNGDTKVFRQFFSLIVGKISHWSREHCTANPNGLQPQCSGFIC